MAISFPVSVPAGRAIRTVRFSMLDAVGASESPYTLSQEIFEHPGKRWAIEVQLAPMKRATAEEWIAMLASLRGRRGTFLLGDPLGGTARGSAGGAPLIKGSGQTGGTLLIDGCGNSIVNWLRKGDWIQLGTGAASRLHKSLTDVDSNGSGEATLELWPGPRVAPPDNAALVVANTVGVWRLASNQRDYDIGLAQMFGITFSAVEAL